MLSNIREINLTFHHEFSLPRKVFNRGVKSDINCIPTAWKCNVFTFNLFCKLCAFNAICKDNAKVNLVAVQHK